MSDEIVKKVKELYDNLMYYPNKILEIFNDFFGEERVDMQGFTNFNELLWNLKYMKLGVFFYNREAVIGSHEFIASSPQNKEIILSLLDNGVLEKPVLSDDNIANYFLPIMTSTLAQSLPKGFIIVHFPMTRVTNENDRYVDVPNLWVKVEFDMQGKGVGYFGINRSEYTIEHMQSDYMHSHVPGINWSNTKSFTVPCMGQGPIRYTVATLAVGYDEAIWKLFCLELDKYMRVESLAGTPYRYLERIGSNNTRMYEGPTTYAMNTIKFNRFSPRFKERDLSDFVRSFVNSKLLKFNYVNGSWGIAMSYTNFTILVSNAFISWYNERYRNDNSIADYSTLLRDDIIRKGIIIGPKIKYLKIGNNSSQGRDYLSFEGKEICTFKGNTIKLHISGGEKAEDNMSIFVNPQIVDVTARAILEIVNYKYGREERTEEVGIGTSARYL